MQVNKVKLELYFSQHLQCFWNNVCNYIVPYVEHAVNIGNDRLLLINASEVPGHFQV
jgi:hypothetical protein